MKSSWCKIVEINQTIIITTKNGKSINVEKPLIFNTLKIFYTEVKIQFFQQISYITVFNGLILKRVIQALNIKHNNYVG